MLGRASKRAPFHPAMQPPPRGGAALGHAAERPLGVSCAHVGLQGSSTRVQCRGRTRTQQPRPQQNQLGALHQPSPCAPGWDGSILATPAAPSAAPLAGVPLTCKQCIVGWGLEDPLSRGERRHSWLHWHSLLRRRGAQWGRLSAGTWCCSYFQSLLLLASWPLPDAATTPYRAPASGTLCPDLRDQLAACSGARPDFILAPVGDGA